MEDLVTPVPIPAQNNETWNISSSHLWLWDNDVVKEEPSNSSKSKANSRDSSIASEGETAKKRSKFWKSNLNSFINHSCSSKRKRVELSGLDPSSITSPADPRDGLCHGMILTGKIVEILQSGVMLQIRPDMEPMLCPASRLSIRLVGHPSELGFTWVRRYKSNTKEGILSQV